MRMRETIKKIEMEMHKLYPMENIMKIKKYRIRKRKKRKI